MLVFQISPGQIQASAKKRTREQVAESIDQARQNPTIVQHGKELGLDLSKMSNPEFSVAIRNLDQSAQSALALAKKGNDQNAINAAQLKVDQISKFLDELGITREELYQFAQYSELQSRILNENISNIAKQTSQAAKLSSKSGDQIQDSNEYSDNLATRLNRLVKPKKVPQNEFFRPGDKA
ncbi:Uncharacterised protein [uncultured archaeon]|nr:Uncharacterised protein [uncultured archaeon]